MENENRNILAEQLELLAEKSKDCDNIEDLAVLTQAMVSVYHEIKDF